MDDGRMSGKEVRELALRVGTTIDDLANTADMNPQTIYRKPEDKKFGHKSTRNLLRAAEQISERKNRAKAVG